MINDPSAVLAIMLDETERADLVTAVARADVVRMSTASYVEIAAVVQRRRNPVLSRRLDELLDSMGVELVPFDAPNRPRSPGVPIATSVGAVVIAPG